MQDSNFTSFPWTQKRLGEIELSQSLKPVLSHTNIVKMITRTREGPRLSNTDLKLKHKTFISDLRPSQML